MAQRGGVLGWLAAVRPATLGAVHQRHDAVMQPVDPEVAPVDQPVRQPLDALEGILETDVCRDDRFHRVNLVEFFGGNGLFDHLFEEQAEEREDEADQDPGAE